jgi:hypothetical protein
MENNINIFGKNSFLKKSLAVLVVSIFIFSCAKDDDAPVPVAEKQDIVSTLVGSSEGDLDAAGTSAKIKQSYGLVQDSQGNIFFTDTYNNKIKKITTTGVVTTFAGTGAAGTTDGAGTLAQFNLPIGIAIDATDNLFVTDYNNHRIRKITPTGNVSTFVGGTKGFLDSTQIFNLATDVQFNFPVGLIFDQSGNLLVCDADNDKIRKIAINAAGNFVSASTFLGTSEGDDNTVGNVKFNNPFGITKDASGNLYITDFYNHKIKKINPAKEVTTIAGGTFGDIDDIGTEAKFYQPYGITINNAAELFVADFSNNKIKKITTSGNVSTVIGKGNAMPGDVIGNAKDSKINQPVAVMIDKVGNLIFTDSNNFKIKKITFK